MLPLAELDDPLRGGNVQLAVLVGSGGGVGALQHGDTRRVAAHHRPLQSGEAEVVLHGVRAARLPPLRQKLQQAARALLVPAERRLQRDQRK